MIPVRYNNIPQAYLDFIDKFKRKIKAWYDAGVMGRGDSIVAVNEECHLIFRFLLIGDNLKTMMLCPSDQLPQLIERMEKKFPQLVNDRQISPNSRAQRSDLYYCLRKAFCSLGYDDADFPNYQMTEALALKACPYCNREEIQYQTITDENGLIHNIMDSELDHFYPKGRIPYLAVCLYNLVPSGRICNGGNGKHEKDTYDEHIVNPFSLQGSDGISFVLDIRTGGILDYKTFDKACSIITLTPNPSLEPNRIMFKIKGLYETEMEQAKNVWIAYRKVAADGLRAVLDDYKQKIGYNLSYEEWLGYELNIDPFVYNNKKLSKLSMDIWHQLIRVRP